MSSVVEQHHEAGGEPVQGGSAAAHAASIDMRRVLHRETHSSRAVAAVIAGALVIALCLYALLEFAVRAIGQPPWLIDPQTAAERITALPAGVPPLLLGAAGAVIAAAGLFFFLSAVLPGRRARHLLDNRLIAVVVDDEVIAAALARSARIAANVTQEQVMVVVSQRQVVVNVRPTSGSPVSENAILQAVEDELKAMGPTPMPQVTVNLSTSGVVGA